MQTEPVAALTAMKKSDTAAGEENRTVQTVCCPSHNVYYVYTMIEDFVYFSHLCCQIYHDVNLCLRWMRY